MRRPTTSSNEVMFQAFISQFNYLNRLMMEIWRRWKEQETVQREKRHLKGVVIRQREAETTSLVVLPPA
jgi:hypothetical protein